MQSTTSSVTPEEEPNELARFRQEWLAELRRRKAATGVPGTATILNDAGEIDAQHESSSKAASNASAISAALLQATAIGTSSQTVAGGSTAFTASAHLAATSLPGALGVALNIYRKAVQSEQSGETENALLLYRQAFRMDAHVDRVFHREEALAAIAAAQKDPLHKPASSILDNAMDQLTVKVQASLTVKPRGGARVTTQALSTLLASFPADLAFEPEIEEEPVHLQTVPDELLVMFLRKLDTTSIERFASVSRKARVIALDSAVWRYFLYTNMDSVSSVNHSFIYRELVRATYNPPQVASMEELTSVLERCLYDYRRVYIEHPRVRLDGVYIATCHYVYVVVEIVVQSLTMSVLSRPGLSDNSWVNVNHLITYHRRFFPNGQVLSLLANEEYTPQQVIPLLKPTLRMKGFYIGTWQLTDTTIQLTNLLDASGRFPLPTDDPLASHHAPVVEGSRYTFVMTLGLVSKPIGRWNKMNIIAYHSVHLETGDIHPVALKHERPFWFSKVRSFGAY
ncbi:hypothetical protein DXG01_005114 [Tephrocybe rancida]|nr:hypothetical protein DXG01_005114 [Tephrocybe rancida]